MKLSEAVYGLVRLHMWIVINLHDFFFQILHMDLSEAVHLTEVACLFVKIDNVDLSKAACGFIKS